MSSCPGEIGGGKIRGLEGSCDPKEEGTKTANSSQACGRDREKHFKGGIGPAANS